MKMRRFQIREKAYAKVNLSLKIIGRREDGYHEIDSVMQTVSLCDDIVLNALFDETSSIESAKRVDSDSGTALAPAPAPAWRLRVCAHPRSSRVPSDGTNLAAKAARLFMKRAAPGWREAVTLSGKAEPKPEIALDLRVTIRKRIPVEAGLGGGSSDAAATLRALARLFERIGAGAREGVAAVTGARGDATFGVEARGDASSGDGVREDAPAVTEARDGAASGVAAVAGALSARDMLAIAREVGADTPFCLRGGGAARARGVGEILSPTASLSSDAYIALVKPRRGVSTARAFHAWDELRAPAADSLTPTKSAGNANAKDGVALAADVDAPAAAQTPAAYGNDLEAVVERDAPEISAIKNLLIKNGASVAQMSGSGSAVFGLFESDASARACRADARSKGFFSVICRPVGSAGLGNY